MPNTTLQSIGSLVAEYRARAGLSQHQLSEATGVTRSAIANLEQGNSLPSPERIEDLCRHLQIPRNLWFAATHPDYRRALEFERQLAGLVGKPVSLTDLDEVSQHLAITAIGKLLSSGMSLTQAHAQFNAVLTFYGEKPVTEVFFSRFLTQNAFAGVEAFERKVQEFQAVALRIYGSFRQAFKRLRAASNMEAELAPLKPIDERQFTERRAFTSIEKIPPDRLDDLGYISADRVRRESRERQELSDKLMQAAAELRAKPGAGLDAMPESRLNRIRTLLRRFGSTLELERTLFGDVDPDLLDREARQVAPRDTDVARIEQTQEIGRRNLAVYLSEPYMDVYIATSMRERADFISVNVFVETLFAAPEVAHLHLRYFNPTLSWVADRVAKGLVEALMLKRARLTVYMAQKTDTFGKDSEASVSLGQGKPVIVYVPKLFDDALAIDSERLEAADEAELSRLRNTLALPDEEGVDRQAETARILHARLSAATPEELTRLVVNHWADFDLYSEIREFPEEVRERARKYLDEVTAPTGGQDLPGMPLELANLITGRLVAVALLYERRAKTFREVHPLALQVILSSGVLNGILVVRSAAACAKVMNRLIRNTLETELVVDDDNYRLVETMTRSTLRVISRHRLLTNAFWTQFFDE